MAGMRVVTEDHAGVLERPVGVEQAPADDPDLRPCQLAAQPDVPILGQADHVVIEEHQDAIFSTLIDGNVVYRGPIKRHLTIDELHSIENILDFGEGIARGLTLGAIDDDDNLDEFSDCRMAPHAGYPR